MTGNKNELFQCFQSFFIRPSSCKKAGVKREKYVDFVLPGTRIRIENGTWNGIQPLPVPEIIKRALSRVGTKDYHLAFNNCEHFARWCRYGEIMSQQADNLMLGLYIGLVALVNVSIILSCWCCERKRSKETIPRVRHL
jgi:hypothetical protein